MKSGGFYGIQQISWWWNLADFMVMKSGGFHGIWWISWWWNPADFMVMKSGRFHGESDRFHMKYTAYLAFSGRGVLGDEIQWISWWNLADFT